MSARLAAILLTAAAGAMSQTSLSISDPRTTANASLTLAEASVPSGSYRTYSSQITLGTGSVALNFSATAGNFSQSTSSQASVSTSSTDSRTYITGVGATTTFAGNFSSTTSTASTPTVTNTRPCNNYPEFCTRKYSNITEVACHNSPFITPNNVAANQQYDVTAQLNDGVRFLQAQIQWPQNGSEPHFCHTSCDILDAGPITDWLGKVKDWVQKHPYDVVTILLGNGNYSSPDKYVPYIESTGILRHIYTPPLVPMKLNDWPTLGEMILSGQRVVMFLDYEADEEKYPWLLDEFPQLWETPFDPTNQTFPCTVQRPPDLSAADARDRLYMLNHNLNIQFSLLGTQILAPARTELAVTNNVTGFGSLGASARGCVRDWNRAPNFLNVDYYNYGGYPGSVFQVAAEFNNVTYSRACCGTASNGGAGLQDSLSGVTVLWAGVLAFGVAVLQAL